MHRHWNHLVVALFLCASVVAALSGQTQTPTSYTAVIEGTVLDAGQAVIPGATVSLEQPPIVIARVVSNARGEFAFTNVAPGAYTLRASLSGFEPKAITAIVPKDTARVAVGRIVLGVASMSEMVTVAASAPMVQTSSGERVRGRGRRQDSANTEAYAPIVSNPFRLTTEESLSTFAADVDTASYSNVRRFLRDGQLPPADAVRIEELVNYFRFSYVTPVGSDPVSITTEVGDCPWAPTHRLALVGVRARPINERAPRRRNIVLLVDVSGSMSSPDKLPLLRTALRMFTDTLRPDDSVAIAVYAGASGLALPPTPGSDRARIHAALNDLEAGGSTNGASGIRLAYATAREQFIDGGINRVILATDGDFNVGVTSQGDLLRLIEGEREHGVFLSVLGVGTGNLKDATMEMLADKGNGNYAYLDSLIEAQRVLVKEGGAMLETVAKDVKFQIEFNPQQVAAWKLIGYENRLLAHEDFNDDRKDGGELGAGHTVTVLYELVPADTPLPADVQTKSGRLVDPLKYQTGRAKTRAAASEDVLTVKLRYKPPAGSSSRLLTQTVRPGGAALHLPFAAAVAEFGLLLRDETAGVQRWTSLSRRIDALANERGAVANGEDLADLVQLAARLVRLRGQ